MNIFTEAKALQGELSRHRRWLHAHPGVAFDIADTVAYVRTELQKLGLSPVPCGRAGLTATVGQGKTCILLRADMDALPIPEESGEEFASCNGAMHACGHDLHTAMLLGAAKLLKDHEHELKGTVKLMFQPAEEIFEGAKDMIEGGVLEAPTPGAAIMLHITAGAPMPTGMVIAMAPASAPLPPIISPSTSTAGAVTAPPPTRASMPSPPLPTSSWPSRSCTPGSWLPALRRC